MQIYTIMQSSQWLNIHKHAEYTLKQTSCAIKIIVSIKYLERFEFRKEIKTLKTFY